MPINLFISNSFLSMYSHAKVSLIPKVLPCLTSFNSVFIYRYRLNSLLHSHRFLKRLISTFQFVSSHSFQPIFQLTLFSSRSQMISQLLTSMDALRFFIGPLAYNWNFCLLHRNTRHPWFPVHHTQLSSFVIPHLFVNSFFLYFFFCMLTFKVHLSTQCSSYPSWPPLMHLTPRHFAFVNVAKPVPIYF